MKTIDFYVSLIKRWPDPVCGCAVEAPEFSQDGVSAREWFVEFDSNGKRVATNDPQGARDILVRKKAFGLQMALWKEGIKDGTSTKQEILDTLQDMKAPKWASKEIAFL